MAGKGRVRWWVTYLDTLHSVLNEHNLAPLLNHLAASVALVESDGSFVDWNPSFGIHMKARPSAATLYDLVAPEYHEPLQALFQMKSVETRKENLQFWNGSESKSIRYTCWLFPLPDGRFLFMADTAYKAEALLMEIQNLDDDLARTKAVLEETNRTLRVKEIELKAVLAQADEVSHTDALTYLPNRRHVIGNLQKEVHRAERYHTPLSISMLDIDHFKLVNDNYGHTVGDQVLLQLANMLREGMRESDMVGRYGGEEFLIILPNTVLTKATEQADRLCRRVREAALDIGEKIHVTISIGVAEYRLGDENWQKFLSRADMALYEAKNAGRDRWAIAR